MAGTITLGGATVITAAEGDYQWQGGARKKTRIRNPIARSDGRTSKPMGCPGATHSLKLMFRVPVATRATIESRMNALFNANSSGELVTPEGTFGDCEFDPAGPVVTTRCWIQASGGGFTDAWRLEYNVTVEQLS